MKIQSIASVISISLVLGLVSQAQAAESPDSRADGFYGGVSYRDNTPSGVGMYFGAVGPTVSRTPSAVVDDSASRALLFGGYRWQNDLAVEAAVSSLDQYALRPLNSGNGQRGIGLRLGPGTTDVQSRSVNVDVFTSWNFYKSVALYGRLGYAQADTPPLAGVAPVSITNSRAVRDGMNYGVGMRYDMNSALGLRLEYARFGRFAGEFGASLPETDQVTLGVQFKF
jgi:opacity protein-like surface antigen